MIRAGADKSLRYIVGETAFDYAKLRNRPQEALDQLIL
jgi:hypothetical protein